MNQDLDFTYAEIYFKAHNVEFSEDKFVALGLKIRIISIQN